MKIFLNYRAGITDPSLAHRIKDYLLASGAVAEVLTSAAGPTQPHADLVRTVSSCDAFVAIIGAGWAEVETASRRLINDPADPIRMEIVAALNRIMPLVPVLVDGATLPEPYDIDQALQGLTLRDGITVESTHLERGLARLMDILAPGASRPPAEASRIVRKDRAAEAKPAPARTAPARPATAPAAAAPQQQPEPQAQQNMRIVGRRSSTMFWSLSVLIIVGLLSGVAFVVSNVMHLVSQVFDLLGVLPKWL